MRALHVLTPLVLSTLLTACATPPTGPMATAPLAATTGNTATGSIQFIQLPGKVLVRGEVHGLLPNTVHGFHIHEKGDCSSGDGMSAGGHFNPDGHAHGAATETMHHAGDLPSLQADASGSAKINFETADLAVGSGPHDVVGRGLIVHKDADDFTTQPTGNSGARLACAVIARN
ncbi:superoxide dismutase family protein [Rhodoferax sp.]|uniref:superoxide dismutase family protein n=1 Tax=Rhodoferax sp. TaxID=50421 RepID=UPI0025E6A90E|nr:superoxide dismutase family protein [Rhodoferax sp.]